jgi:dihydrofolate reductase
MKITFVVAVAKNRVIGSHNSLPFYIPEDLKHFKRVTEGHTILMGKNTFDSIMNRIGKPLPNRTNVVITRQMDYKAPEGVIVFHDLDTALSELEKTTEELMVGGGSQIYKQLLDMGRVDKMIITHVDYEVDGDVLFPEVDYSKWNIISEEPREDFRWVVYEKK